MRVFISWSKRVSMEYAIKTKQLLEELDPNIEAFVSELDIVGGENVQVKIIESINACDKLILCFTKETKKSPWLLFEAGYARGCGKTVIPLLFDVDPNWHSWIDNPMNVARELRFSGYRFTSEFLEAFGIKNIAKNRQKVEQYKRAIEQIKDKSRLVDVECQDVIEKLIADSSFHIDNPYYKDKTAFFLTGFESFELYKIITDSFIYSGKYLWFYGRKNMKLFSGNFRSFFKYLQDKAFESQLNMDGIDFRCLFLNPESEEVKRAHMQQEIFVPELHASILRAKTVVNECEALKKCFRMYSGKRDEIIIRLDNCIIYSRPVFDAGGRPQLLTNTGFEVFSVFSERGQKCIKTYEKIWNGAQKMF